MIAWGAVRTLARHEWRRRWQALLLLGVASGLFAGTALAVTTVLWRTETAYDRLVSATQLDDVRVSIMTATAVPSERPAILALQRRASAWLAANPVVTHSREVSIHIGRIEGPGVAYASVYSPVQRQDPFARPVLVEGRAPRVDSPNEVMVEQGRAKDLHLHPGDRIPMDLLTPKQFQEFSSGPGAPAGAHVDLVVVGAFRYPVPRFGFDSLVASPAFDQAFRSESVGVIQLLATRGQVGPGSGPGSITATADALESTLQSRYGSGQQRFVALDRPRSSPDPAVGPTTTVLRSGLVALVTVVAVAGLILTAQLAGRWAERGRASQDIENALGLRAIERAFGRFVAGIPTVLLTAALAVTGALLGGLPEPLGSLGKYEPSPGWLPRAPIAVVGTVLVLVLFVGVVVVTTVRAGRPRRLPARRQRRWWGRLALRRIPLLAMSLSSGRGGPSTTVPARSMVVGLAAMLAALVVVGDVHEQLSDLRAQPARWGWTADFGVVDDTARVDARLARDPRVRDLEQVTDAPVLLRAADGAQVSTTGYGRMSLRGHLPWTLGAGRLPRAGDEVALGPRALHDLGIGVGDEVSVVVRGTPTSVRVVGVVLVPSANDGALGRDALFTQPGMRRAAGALGFSTLFVRARDDAAAASLHRRLVQQYELTEPDPPASISAIDELGTPTRGLLVILLLAAVLLVGQDARLLLRRRGGQLAIVDAMGMSRRGLIAAAALSLVWTSLLATLVGLPLGWALSRIVLVQVGPRLGLILSGPGVVAAALAGGAVLALTAIVSIGSTTLALAGRGRAPALDGS